MARPKCRRQRQLTFTSKSRQRGGIPIASTLMPKFGPCASRRKRRRRMYLPKLKALMKFFLQHRARAARVVGRHVRAVDLRGMSRHRRIARR